MSTKIYLVTWCHFQVAGIQPDPGIATKYILKRVHSYSGLRILDSDTENKYIGTWWLLQAAGGPFRSRYSYQFYLSI